jgi:integrase
VKDLQSRRTRRSQLGDNPLYHPVAREFSQTEGSSPRTHGINACSITLCARLGFSGHVLRHTFGTRLIRDGYDLVLVAELMGHARTETTRGYSPPTADDAQAAINSLPADR